MEGGMGKRTVPNLGNGISSIENVSTIEKLKPD